MPYVVTKISHQQNSPNAHDLNYSGDGSYPNLKSIIKPFKQSKIFEILKKNWPLYDFSKMVKFDMANLAISCQILEIFVLLESFDGQNKV